MTNVTHKFLSIYLFFICNSLHVSSTLCSSSTETNFVNTTSGNRHSVLVAVSCAGWEWIPNLYTTRPPTKCDSYQRLYWQNLSPLMMSTMCSKPSEKKKYIEKNLCVTLVIYQESLHDARSTKYKISISATSPTHRHFCQIRLIFR
jgi:hypothetical protein